MIDSLPEVTVRIHTCLTIFLLLVSNPPLLRSHVLHVPGDFTTIQGAIGGAENGDTVLVSPGTYYEYEIDFLGKAITVTSADPDDPNIVTMTVVDAGFQGRAFHFSSGEDSASILTGFTLTGGHTDSWGGGIRCDSSSPRIALNVIKSNSSSFGGGGIYLDGSRAVITGNTISDNTAQWGGGGIRCSTSSPFIIGNTITGNTSDYGGGIDCHYGSHPVIIGNAIADNLAGDGGGIYCYEFSSPVISGNIISRNQAEYGGGLHSRYSSPTDLWNNTFAGNQATIEGGAIRCRYSSPVTAINSIFWGNSAPVGDEFYLGDLPSPNQSSLTISYSDVEGGESSIFAEEGNEIDWGPGMIETDPAFVDSQRRDYRLLWNSPCIDTGHPDSLDDDNTRRDMGALSFDQNEYLTLYLTPDTTEAAPGSRLGVTYTVINRWGDPVSFLLETSVILPDGREYGLIGPNLYYLPGDRTARVHAAHAVPLTAPSGFYRYRSSVEVFSRAISGEDSFVFEILSANSLPILTPSPKIPY